MPEAFLKPKRRKAIQDKCCSPKAISFFALENPSDTCGDSSPIARDTNQNPYEIMEINVIEQFDQREITMTVHRSDAT